MRYEHIPILKIQTINLNNSARFSYEIVHEYQILIFVEFILIKIFLGMYIENSEPFKRGKDRSKIIVKNLKKICAFQLQFYMEIMFNGSD